MTDVLHSVKEAQNLGGINLKIGSHENARTYRFYPIIGPFCGDNQGSHHCACIKTGKTFRPCRICRLDRVAIFDVDSEPHTRDSSITADIQKEAFNGLNQQLGNEQPTAHEKVALALCKSESIQPMLSHMLSMKTPFPGFSNHLLFPPDLLHTVCGGVLKNFIFWAFVIIIKVSEVDGNFKDSAATLDDLISAFPIQQSCPTKGLRFPKGISDFCKAASSYGISSKETSTSGLGGIDHQYIPSLVLQLLLAIGFDGDILPNTKNWESAKYPKLKKFGSLTDVVVSAGFIVLDLFYTLSRKEFTLGQLQELKELISTAQTHLHRLFTVKQLLIGSKKPYGGIKLHMLYHFVVAILYFGSPKVFDMIRFEKKHRVAAKIPFQKGKYRIFSYSHIFNVY